MKYLPVLRLFIKSKVTEGAVAIMSRKNMPDLMYADIASFIVVIPFIRSAVMSFNRIWTTQRISTVYSINFSLLVTS
jgi:hypothetical protein